MALDMQALFGGYPMTHRPFYTGPYEFVHVCSKWPVRIQSQRELLRSLPSWCWRPGAAPEVIAAYGQCRRSPSPLCHMTADLTLDLGFGNRWFHIWWDPLFPDEFLATKEPSPSHLIISCKFILEESRVGFELLSGAELAAYDIDALLCRRHKCLTVYDLEEVAFSEALFGGVLETRNQTVNLVVEGFQSELPRDLIIWNRTKSMEVLSDRLSRLRTMSPKERLHIAVLEAGASDVSPVSSIGSETSADTSSTEGRVLFTSVCDGLACQDGTVVQNSGFL